MKRQSLFLFVIAMNFVQISCVEAQTGGTEDKPKEVVVKSPPKAVLPVYNNLLALGTETLQAAPGTKSVLFNGDGTRLYALNLEGMSVYEFEQKSRKVIREFKFKPTRGTGWDYDTDKPIKSFKEKPVEACFSHNDSILWVSLHNADGIVPLFVKDSKRMTDLWSSRDTASTKLAILNTVTKQIDSAIVPLIKTGKTPKVIAVSEDSKHLMVSNWHSYNVSVLELDANEYPFGKVIKDVSMGAIPRGVVIDDKRDKSYVAIMGGARIAVIDNKTWSIDTPLNVTSNPRHLVMDNDGRLFVSYNKLSQIACVDPSTGKTLFTAATGLMPRTIMLSKNKKFLFVTCYKGDEVQVFKINDNSFTKLYSLPCKGSPVGVDIFEDEHTLEAWVCNYTLGSIKIFSFKKE